MDRSEVERRILSRGWLSQQTPAFQDRLLASAREQPYGAGEALFHAGDGAGGAYGVVSGGIGISVPLHNGTMVLAHVARTGTWFGHGPLFTRQPRILSFAATEPSLTLHVPLPDLDRITAESPLHARGVGGIADFGAVVAIMVSRDLLIRSTIRRIAATLLRVTTGDDGTPPDDPGGYHLTQTQVGEMANASRDLVNRTLTRLEQAGIVTVGYGRIAICDPERLAAFAHGGD